MYAIIISVLSVVIITIFIYKVISPETDTFMSSVQFTSLPGNEYSPALSPDGSQIAFTWSGQTRDNRDIYLKSIDDDSLRRLTYHPGDDERPAWSPDGGSVAFVRIYKGNYGIYILDLEKGEMIKLPAANWAGIINLSWSPDGNYIAISGKLSRREPYSIFQFSLRQQVLEKITSPSIQFSGDSDCHYSPDGKMIAFERSMSLFGGDIFVMSLPDDKPKRLTFDNRWIGGMAWSGDGEELVFSSDRGGNQSLWRVSISGGTPERLPVHGKRMIYPSISRSGDRLAYVDHLINMNIYRVGIGERENNIKKPEQFISSSRRDYQPSFSADGSKIVFTSERTSYNEIWISDSTGSNAHRVTKLQRAMTGRASWSPNGDQIVFQAFADGHCQIFISNADGSELNKLTTSESDNKYPCWSADGKWIYFMSKRTGAWQIWRISSRGTNSLQITSNGGNAPRISPDGKWLYYLKMGKSPIYKCPAHGGEEIIAYNIPLIEYQWCLSDEGMYFINRSESIYSIDYYDNNTDQIKRILNVGKKQIAHPTISPNGKWLVYTQLDQSESDIILVNNFR
jgi:Tol biopolymer transport system component